MNITISKRALSRSLSIFALAASMTTLSHAAEILVTQNIAQSTTWTANNTYNLKGQIYVLSGATLTIEAGTLIASDDPGIWGKAGLVVCRGAQIFAMGTKAKPIIMTSKADVATWTNGNPKTGVWRPVSHEWGNLSILGEAYIGNAYGDNGNTSIPNPNNHAIMEGLLQQNQGDPLVRYGGGQDDDDSGTVKYISLRYGGHLSLQIPSPTGASAFALGGVGRSTDIHHVEVMNGLDDGVQLWGGTVNLKYINIWNVGDNSFEVDNGWRGKAQFGLIVHGYCESAQQGVSDAAFVMAGADGESAQPVTTASLYNFTVVGNPVWATEGTFWYSNARAQFRNSIFMDLGHKAVAGGGNGSGAYGLLGTLTWEQTWLTDYNAVPPHYNDAPSGLSGWLGYQAQSSGKLIDFKDNVFFRNLDSAAYTEANARGVFDPANHNVLIPGIDDLASPVKKVTRGPVVLVQYKPVLPVTGIDPRPANEATTSFGTAPGDGFFTQAQYRGGFGLNENWLCEWTATDAFGFNLGPCGPRSMVQVGGVVPCLPPNCP